MLNLHFQSGRKKDKCAIFCLIWCISEQNHAQMRFRFYSGFLAPTMYTIYRMHATIYDAISTYPSQNAIYYLLFLIASVAHRVMPAGFRECSAKELVAHVGFVCHSQSKTSYYYLRNSLSMPPAVSKQNICIKAYPGLAYA